MMIGISLAVTAPRGGRRYDFTETHAFTAAAEDSTADQTGLDFLQSSGGTSLVEVQSGNTSFPYSDTLWTINADGSATFKPGSVYQYLISGTTATASKWALDDAGARIKYTVTISGSYVFSLALKPEDGESFSSEGDPTGSLPADTDVTFFTGFVGKTVGTVTRTGGAAGVANVLLGSGGTIRYEPSGSTTLDGFSAQLVASADDGDIATATCADGSTFVVSLSGTTLTATLTEGASSWSASRTISGDYFTFSVRIAEGVLGLLVNGDTAGSEDTTDVSSASLSSAYTRLDIGEDGQTIFGGHLRTGDITTAQSVTYLDAVTAERMPTSAITARTVVFDFADNHGHGTLMGVRSIEFKSGGSTISLPGTGYTAYATTEFSGTFVAGNAFDTSKLETGVWNGTSWIASNATTTNQRLIIVFDSEQTFDEIVVNNNHTSGTLPETGVQNTEITWTASAYTNTTYGAAVTGGTSLGSTAWTIHPASDAAADVTEWSV